MSVGKKFDKKYLFAVLILGLLFVFSGIFKEEFFNGLKITFEWPYLEFIFGGLSTIFFLLHYLKFKSPFFLNDDNKFREFVGFFMNIFSNGTALSVSFSLAKGAFLQHVFNIDYYPFFKGFNLILLEIVVGYILFQTLRELYKTIVEVVYERESINVEVREGEKLETTSAEIKEIGTR